MIANAPRYMYSLINDMHTILSAFWLAEDISIYSKQCKTLKLRMIDTFLSHWEPMLRKLILCKCWKITCQISLSFSTNNYKVIVSEACELSWIKNIYIYIVCMLLTSNPMISCGINLDQMSTWNFSKTTNWTCYTHAILWVFGKITCAHLFQIPLKIMWLL